MLCTIIIHYPLRVLEKPGMGNEEIGNEKWKQEMGNGDIRTERPRLHPSLLTSKAHNEIHECEADMQ